MDHIMDNLYIGDKEDAGRRNQLELHDIVYVVTLCKDETRYTTVHHPINDGINEQSDFDRGVEIVSEALNLEENVLVHCASGMSRSVTVVATAIADLQDLSFEDALEIVAEHRLEANPHPDMVDHGEEYLS